MQVLWFFSPKWQNQHNNVDDLFLEDVHPLIMQCKKELALEFDMKDLDLMHYYLGLEVW
jgi:hypothetical protein